MRNDTLEGLLTPISLRIGKLENSNWLHERELIVFNEDVKSMEVNVVKCENLLTAVNTRIKKSSTVTNSSNNLQSVKTPFKKGGKSYNNADIASLRTNLRDSSTSQGRKSLQPGASKNKTPIKTLSTNQSKSNISQTNKTNSTKANILLKKSTNSSSNLSVNNKNSTQYTLTPGRSQISVKAENSKNLQASQLSRQSSKVLKVNKIPTGNVNELKSKSSRRGTATEKSNLQTNRCSNISDYKKSSPVCPQIFATKDHIKVNDSYEAFDNQEEEDGYVDISNIITMNHNINEDLFLIKGGIDTTLNSHFRDREDYFGESILEMRKPYFPYDYLDVLEPNWSSFAKFLNLEDTFKLSKLNKTLRRLCINDLNKHLKSEIKHEEKIINELRSFPEEELNRYHRFTLSKGSLKALELLNDPVHLKFFAEEQLPNNNDIILIMGIYLILLGGNVVNSAPEEIWKQMRNLFKEDETEGIGITIQGSLEKLDFSLENIDRIRTYVKDKLKMINPSYYSKQCATTGFLTFIVKDALEHAGLIINEKKNLISQLYKLSEYTYHKKCCLYEEFSKRFLSKYQPNLGLNLSSTA